MNTSHKPNPMAERLRKLRGYTDLKPRDLALLAGLHSVTHIGLLESGVRRRAAAETLVPIARVLGTTVEWLINGEGVEPDEHAVKAAVARARERAEKAA